MGFPIDFGKRIILKRLLKALEKEGYKVEYAADYDGYIVSDKRDDPCIFLLDNGMIDQLQRDNPGKPEAFVDAAIRYVRAQIAASTASIPPPAPAGSEAIAPPPLPVGPPPPVGVPEETEEETCPKIPAFSAPPSAPSAPPSEDDDDDIQEISGIIPDDTNL